MLGNVQGSRLGMGEVGAHAMCRARLVAVRPLAVWFKSSPFPWQHAAVDLGVVYGVSKGNGAEDLGL
jgi:hypothetical protein